MNNKKDLLTKRELDVLSLIVAGQTNPEIAQQLSISIHTVKAHIENIYTKLNVNNKVQVCITAIHNGIINIDDFKI